MQSIDARIKRIAGERLKAELDNGRIVIVAGFQGINQMGDVTTLAAAARTPPQLPLQQRSARISARSTPT